MNQPSRSAPLRTREPLDAVALPLGDERADVLAELGARVRARQPLRELLEQRTLDVDPLGADARLACVDERREQRTVDRALEIRVGEDDHRILAAELEHHRAAARSGGCRHAASDADGAGEEHLRDARAPRRSPRRARASPCATCTRPGRRARLLEAPRRPTRPDAA